MGLSAYALLGLPGLGPTFAPASWLLAARMLESGPTTSVLMLGTPVLLGGVAWRAFRAREQATDAPPTLASPIAHAMSALYSLYPWEPSHTWKAVRLVKDHGKRTYIKPY